MDPLSVAMSIVGLLKAGEQISSTLQPIISKAVNAPKEIKDLKSSVDVISTVLCQLQLMLLGHTRVNRHRSSLILVDQIVITLSACVTTFSELDVFVDTLGTDDKMGLLDRMRWAMKSSTIQEHLHKLEVHKSTLTLMLTILTCDSTRTAEDSVDVLATTIEHLLESNLVIAQRLASIEVGLGVTADVPPLMESGTRNETSTPFQRNVQGFAFEEELNHSWVYTRSTARADNVQALPIYEQDLSNSEFYKFGDFTATQPLVRASTEKPNQSFINTKAVSPGSKNLKSWLTRHLKPRLGGNDNSSDDVPRIFGVALRESICYANVMITAVNNEGEKFVIGYVPIVVAKICVLLKEKGTESEDIFARSGSANRVHQLEIIFDTPDRYGKGLDWSGYSVHDAATCLLRYLKRLPEPVISFEFYNRFTSIDFDAGIEEEAINAFKDCSTDLQPMPRMLLMYIIDLVQVFASKSKTNKMTTARLVAAFQPSLLAKDPSVGMSAYDHQRAADTITFLVENDFSSILLIAKTETKTDGGEDDIALATEGEGEEQEEA